MRDPFVMPGTTGGFEEEGANGRPTAPTATAMTWNFDADFTSIREGGNQSKECLVTEAMPPSTAHDATVLRKLLRADLVAAMKARDAEVVTALRTAIAAVDNAEAVEAASGLATGASDHIAGATAGVGSTEAERRVLDVDDVRGILRHQIAERQTEADRLEELGRDDVADRLRREAAALSKYVGQ